MHKWHLDSWWVVRLQGRLASCFIKLIMSCILSILLATGATSSWILLICSKAARAGVLLVMDPAPLAYMALLSSQQTTDGSAIVGLVSGRLTVAVLRQVAMPACGCVLCQHGPNAADDPLASGARSHDLDAYLIRMTLSCLQRCKAEVISGKAYGLVPLVSPTWVPWRDQHNNNDNIYAFQLM